MQLMQLVNSGSLCLGCAGGSKSRRNCKNKVLSYSSPLKIITFLWLDPVALNKDVKVNSFAYITLQKKHYTWECIHESSDVILGI